MPKVVHCKREPFDVMIDRSTKWGNPFHIGVEYVKGAGPMTREQAISQYEDWLTGSDQGRKLLESISELRGKDLGCWCAPKPCHGDILLRLANE